MGGAKELGERLWGGLLQAGGGLEGCGMPGGRGAGDGRDGDMASEAWVAAVIVALAVA